MKSPLKKNIDFDIKVYANYHVLSRKGRDSAPLNTQVHKENICTKKKSRYSLNILKESSSAQKGLKNTMKKAMQMYDYNLEIYDGNVGKLINVIIGELKSRNYLQAEMILEFFKKKGDVIFQQRENLQSFGEQLKFVIEFLLQNYQKKKMKEISITCDMIKEEQEVIIKKASAYEFDEIYNMLELKTSRTHNMDFIAEYEHICTNFGMKDTNVKTHSTIKDHLEASKEKVAVLFEKSLNRKFLVKTRSKLSERFY